jgi:hypothetical protein
MAVAAKTFETYQNSLIFEDLQNAYSMLSPTECPFQMAVGSGTCDATNYEWPVVELNAVDPTNRVIEGEDAPATDDPTNGVRLANFTQISDKKIIVSHTSEAVSAAADNLQKIAKQMTFKMKELKRDKEVMFLQNIAASAGASGTARTAAGFPAFLRTNTIFAAGGADPTLSGITEGYPDAAATDGTAPEGFTEDQFNDAIQMAWENGGDPTLVLVNANNKRIISETFVGNATRYKDTVDQKVINSIDFYESDFGTLTIVPTRFMLPADGVGGTNFMVLGIDPEFVHILYLEALQEAPLAKTGHNNKRLMWTEYTLQVDNEAAHFIIRDTDGIMPAP